MGATFAAVFPSDSMVLMKGKPFRASVVFALAVAAMLPLFFSMFVSNAAACLWTATIAGLVGWLGLMTHTQGSVIKALEGTAGTDNVCDVGQDTKHPDPDALEATATCYSLIANSSPAKTVAAPAPAPDRFTSTARQHSSGSAVAVADSAPCLAETSTPDPTAADSPACMLLAAAARSGKSSRSGSAADSGKSQAAATGVVESVMAVAALRRSKLRYRSSVRPAGSMTASGAGHGRSGGSAAAVQQAHTQLHIKIPHMEPGDLRPDLLSAVNDSLRMYNSGLQVVGAYVRRGCVELTLDLVECGANARAGGGAHTLSEEEALSSLLLSALRVQPPPPDAAAAHAGASPSVADPHLQEGVVFQQGRHCWNMVWNAMAQRWQLGECSEAGALGDGGPAAVSGGDGSSGRVWLSAPLAVHAPTQLTARATASGRGALRLAVGLRAEHGGGGSDTGMDDLTVIAKANGRTMAVPMLSSGRRSICLTTGAVAAASSSASAAPSSFMLLEFDLARLAAGRPERSPGLVVRLELKRGHRVLDVATVACLADERAVSELLAFQRELAASGRLEPEDDGYLDAAQQREEAQQLLGDLGAWLDFTAVCTAADMAATAMEAARRRRLSVASASGARPSAASHSRGREVPVREEAAEAEAATGESLDMSDQLAVVLRSPLAQSVMMTVGQHLRRFFVSLGHVALARIVHAGLAPRAAALAGAAAAADEDDEDMALPLLHRAVRSGRPAMVEEVLRWVCGGGAAAAAGVCVWGATGADGLTALHVLAADVPASVAPSCLEDEEAAAAAAAEEAVADGTVGAPPMEAEALLCWIMSTWPAAVSVWNSARDAGGNTPAMLWAAMGGRELQMVAAAAALQQIIETRFSTDSGSPSCNGNGHGHHGVSAPGALGLYGWVVPPAITASSRSSGGSASPSAETAHRSAAAAAAPPPTPPAGPEALLMQPGAAAPGLATLMRLSLFGFQSPSLEREYMDYVTRTTSPSTFMWLAIMVLAHLTAFFKSPNGEGRQALVGGAAYVVSLTVMVLYPRTYTAAREQLMMSCLLGRTLCRLLMTVLPELLHMSQSVQKYILYGVDILLDGFMEGTFEQFRLRRALVARLLLEWPIMAAFMASLGVGRTLVAAALRAAAVSSAGLAMSAITDMRSRSVFLRQRRARAAKDKAH